jgi:hypothetical protein
MKRMILAFIVFLWDIWGFIDMSNTYQELKASREIPLPELSSMLQGEILKWTLIGLASVAFGIWGLMSWKKGR